MNPGNSALALALVAGLLALVLYGLWACGRAGYRGAARLYTGAMALFVFIASAFQMLNILSHRFEYEYVVKFSDRSLPTLLLAATFWGGQAGSFLLWSLWSALFGVVLMIGLRRSSWEPFVLTPYLLIALSITGIMWASGPFRTLENPPADGQGLNPLLQNYWMAIHPPILFTGFTSMAGPFAFAVAALWRRDYDGWVKLARPWILLAWVCLGTGLALGGFWAYESLGWGGFWGWDPVENSSFVPWLIASALMHGLVIQGSRGAFKRGNLFLAITGELTVIYSTFLTRSGILGQFSVHSFVELGLMAYLVIFIAAFALLGFGLLAWRWRAIGQRVLYSSVLSREFGLVISVTLLLIIALIVGVGTSMPVISLLPGFTSQASVDLGFYGPMVTPFGALLLLVMAIGPLLSWQRDRYGRLGAALKWPAVLSGVALFICLLLNINYPIALILLCGAVFAASANVLVIGRIWRAGPLKLGGYLSHIGVGLLFVGIVGNAYYKQTVGLQLTQDVPQTVFGRQFTFRNIVLPPADELKRTAVQLEVTNPQDGQTWIAEAPYYVYPKSGQLVIHPSIESGLWGDLYIAPSQYLPPNQAAPGRVELRKEQPLTLLDYTLNFKQFDLPNRDAMMRGDAPAMVNAVMSVTTPNGTTTTITPTVRVAANGALQGDPTQVTSGVTVTIMGLDPTNQSVVVQLGGVDLSGISPDELKARVFVDVSIEPGIKFAWAGIIIGILGGLLALLRRWREAHPASDALAAPRLLGSQSDEHSLQPVPRPIVHTESEVTP